MFDFLTRSRQSRRFLIFPFILGFVYALFYLDVELLTENHDGLENAYVGDALANQIGLNYYIKDDWRFPLFKSPNISFLEGGGNVINSDSIPIMALFAKIAYKLFGIEIDYLGRWLFFCLSLQAVAFCWILRIKNRLSIATAVMGSLFSLSTPCLLFRWGHIALCSQFLLLFAIGFYLIGRQRFRVGTWGLLAVLYSSIFITAYLFAMVLGVFAVHLGQSWVEKKIDLGRGIVLALGSWLGIICIAILMGYIEFGRYTPKSSGYGLYSMNALSPFVPQHSGILPGTEPSLDANGGQYEGMNWLGFGLIGLSMFAVGCLKFSGMYELARRHLFLFTYVIFLTIFAISNEIWVGGFHLASIHLNSFWDSFLGQFRSSGRMFWMVSYIILVVAFLKASTRLNYGILVISVLALIQVWDVAPHFGNYKHRATRTAEELQFADTAGRLIAEHQRVYIFPPYNVTHPEKHRMHRYIQFLASSLGRPVSCAYMNRRFTKESPREIWLKHQATGIDEGGVYFFLGDWVGLAEVSSFFSGGKAIRKTEYGFIGSGSARIDEMETILGALPELDTASVEFGRLYDCGKEDGGSSFLVNGLGLGEIGQWTDAREAGLFFGIPDSDAAFFVLEIAARPYFHSSFENRMVSLRVGDEVAAQWKFDPEMRAETRRLTVRKNLIKEGKVSIRWSFVKTASPAELGESEDPRHFGLEVASFKILPSVNP